MDGKERLEPPAPLPDGVEDAELFRWAVRDVRRIAPGGTAAAQRRPRVPAAAEPRPDFPPAEWDLVASTEGEHIEGAHASVSRALLRRLRRGEFSIQAHCDLHRMTRVQAQAEVSRFIQDSVRRGLGCVCIVHGRGINSPGMSPVLKTSLQEWLAGRKLARHILAYCSALPRDGGTGAVYVLLRRT